MISYTMARASFLTPIFFFSSIRAGSGKASIVTNLSVYLNNLSQKIAIIDLDADAPLKLKNSFPQSISLQEYADVNLLAKGEDSRYQKNFYFTETSLISYFPAHQLRDPALLFTDTTLRDFFIQLKASFDSVIINFPAGPIFCLHASELLAKAHLWRGSKPLSIIVSQADEKSLVNLDSLLQKNPALSYQIQENTMLLFNRVPSSPEDLNIAESTLNSFELRRLFDAPLSYIIPIIDEFSQQRINAGPLVLKADSLLHQAISSLHRLLSHAGENPVKELSPRSSDFQACLDGDLLEKLTPYLERIQIAAAARLYIHPSELQVFLEEGSGNFRIRIRLAGVSQPLLGINPRIPLEPQCKMVIRLSPGQFTYPARQQYATPLVQIDKGNISAFVCKSVYKFDDYFLYTPEPKLHRQIDLQPEKPKYPSPILFKPSQTISEIPSLSQILGYTRQTYQKLGFEVVQELYKISGVTHFFIPPEFPVINTGSFCNFPALYRTTQNLVDRNEINHSRQTELLCDWPEVRNSQAPDLPDAFARNQPFAMENDFLLRSKPDVSQELPSQTFANIRFSADTFIETSPLKFLEVKNKTLGMQSSLIPGKLPIWLKSSLLTETRLLSNLVIKVITPASSIPFSIHSGAWPGAYQDSKQHSAKMQMQQSLYFALAAEKSPQKPETYKLPANFIAVKFHSPAFFCQSEAITPVTENLHSKDAFKFPARFAWEDLLLDYVYRPWTKISWEKPVYSSQSKPELVFRPESCLFFKQEFSGYKYSQMPSELFTGRINLSYVFQLSSAALKTIPQTISAARPKTANEILHVKAKIRFERNYKDIAGALGYRTDYITDSSLKLRKLPAMKSNMMQIDSLKADYTGPIVKIFVAKLAPKVISNSAKPELLFSRDLKMAEINNDPSFLTISSEIFKNYKPSSANLPVKSFWQSIDQKKNIRTVFSATNIELSTLTMRQEYRKFHNFPGRGITTRIDLMPKIVKRPCNFLTPVASFYTHKIIHDQIEIPAALPLRIRKTENYNLESANTGKFELRIERVMNAIAKQSGTFPAADNDRSVKQGNLQPRVLLNTMFSLVVAAPASYRRLPQRRDCFNASFPEPLEVLYQHLLWQLGDERSSGLNISEDSLKQKHEVSIPEFLFPRQAIANKQILYSEKPAFASISRLRQKHTRELLAIANLSLRDLMNLARETTLKFSAISNKMRA